MTIGAERQTLCVVEDFVSDANVLRDVAVRGVRPAPDSGLYPGVRAPAPAAYQAVLMATLSQLAREVFDIDTPARPTLESYCSMVATPPRKLLPAQRIPHFDMPKQSDLAVMHYLCDERHGGTSFYRHRSSGYEYIDEQRMPGYFKTLEDEAATQGLPEPPAYICGDTALFERVHSVAARWNRLLVYRTSSLHSGDIRPDYDFDMNPMTGRFTIASFWRSGL
ncbi:MAG: DUF6445 family protein [Pseudomonadota bacterium]